MHPAYADCVLSQDGPQSRAALATANRRSALLRFRRKREARTFDKKVRFGGSYRSISVNPRYKMHDKDVYACSASGRIQWKVHEHGMISAMQVRYASRKRLAEARPRVRGQFVKAEVAAAFFAAQKVQFSHGHANIIHPACCDRASTTS